MCTENMHRLRVYSIQTKMTTGFSQEVADDTDKVTIYCKTSHKSEWTEEGTPVRASISTN
jgi:hypothetical protein